MKLIVGLGNPGQQYDKTRHNAGFLAVDRLADRHMRGVTPRAKFAGVVVEGPIRNERCVLLKPTTYMNRSGQSVAEAVGFYKLDPAQDVLVIVDDVSLPSGQIRLRPSGGAGGHNGLADIQRALGTEGYPRCRVGIDATPPFMDQADYVLGRFSPEQWAGVDTALSRSADAAEVFVTDGLAKAMNQFNPSSPPKPKPPRRENPAPAPESGPSGSRDG